MPPDSALNMAAPRQPFAFYALVVCAALTAIVGAAALYGWHYDDVAYTRVAPTWPLVPYHTGAAMLVIGFGYLAWAARLYRVALTLAIPTLALTLTTLLRYWAGLHIALEEATLQLTGISSQPILISPHGALTFFILSATLIGLARPYRSGHLLSMIGFAASMAAAFTLPAILGYALGMPNAYRWRAVSGYAFLPALFGLLLSVAVLAYAWKSAQLSVANYPRWLPVSLWLLFVFATLLYVKMMRDEQAQLAAISEQRFAADIARLIEGELNIRISDLKRIAARAQSVSSNRTEWEADAATVLKDFGGYDSISIRRPGAAADWSVFAAHAPSTPGPAQAAVAAIENEATEKDNVVFSPVFTGADARKKFFVRVPLPHGGQSQGLVGATIDVDRFFSAILDRMPQDVLIRVSDSGGPFYQRSPSRTPAKASTMTRIRASGVNWLVELDPGTAVIDPTRSRLPGFALVAGLLFATLLAYSVRLFQISRARAFKMEEANLRLIEEIEERTRLEERTRQIIESTYDAFVSMSGEGLITDWNPAAQQIFGWSRDEAVGRPLVEMIVPLLYRESHSRGMRRFQETGESRILGRRLELPAINKAGAEFPIELTISSLRDGDAISFHAFIHDISERQALQQRLSESHDFYLRLFENFPALVWRARADGGRDYFNTTWLNFTGRTVEQESGDGWRVNVHPDDIAQHERAFNQALAARGPYEVELRLCNAEQEYRWVIESGRPFFDLDGNYAGFIGSCVDVSRSKQLENALRESNEDLESRVEARTSELYQTNVQLKQEIDERAAAQVALKHYADDLARSNAELEQFAYVASHDLQEPLRMVSSYAQLLHRRYYTKLDADAGDFINFIVEGALRMQQLIEDLLAFSRLGSRPTQFATVDCMKIVQTVRTNQEKALAEGGISFEVGPLPQVWGDSTLLGQLFQALVSNAIKFRRTNAPYIRIHAEQLQSEWKFSVADNGIGIEPQYFERIFVIFQRLHSKADYPGTGIGLAICKKIVERHGGRIWLESETGKGTTFYFTLRTVSDG